MHSLKQLTWIPDWCRTHSNWSWSVASPSALPSSRTFAGTIRISLMKNYAFEKRKKITTLSYKDIQTSYVSKNYFHIGPCKFCLKISWYTRLLIFIVMGNGFYVEIYIRKYTFKILDIDSKSYWCILISVSVYAITTRARVWCKYLFLFFST